MIEKVINEWWVGKDGERKRNIKEHNKTESSYIRLCYTHHFELIWVQQEANQCLHFQVLVAAPPLVLSGPPPCCQREGNNKKTFI